MTDFEELWEKTIQSQYSNSPHIKGIIEAYAKAIDPNAEIEDFYKKIFDPRTATGFGLDIWGVIVGASRYIEIDSSDFWGLRGQLMKNLNEAPFYNEGTTDIYELDDDAFRELIFLKAYANIADSTMPTLKKILNLLYPGGAIAIEAEHMKLRFIFLSYDLEVYSLAILKQYGLLCLGAGVGWEYYILAPTDTFGFDGSEMETFDNGIFAPYNVAQP